MNRKELRRHIGEKLVRWAKRLEQHHALPVVLIGAGEDGHSGEYVLCVPDVEAVEVMHVLRQVLGELERQIFAAAVQEAP